MTRSLRRAIGTDPAVIGKGLAPAGIFLPYIGRKLPRGFFWSFLNGLTEELLGGDLPATRERWAWSNLLKIGAFCNDDPKRSVHPNEWPPALRHLQRTACAAALKEELRPLENTLPLIVSGDHFGITPEVFDDDGTAWRNEGSKTAPRPNSCAVA